MLFKFASIPHVMGTGNFANQSHLDKRLMLDLLFANVKYEFVQVPTSEPGALVNGTWTGLLGHIMNDKHTWIRHVQGVP